MYSLHRPNAISLHKEMIRVGLTHYASNTPAYLQLLLEAMMVVITRKYWELMQKAQEDFLEYDINPDEEEHSDMDSLSSGIEECMKQKMAGKKLEELEKDTLFLESPRKKRPTEINKSSPRESKKATTSNKKGHKKKSSDKADDVTVSPMKIDGSLDSSIKECFLSLADYYAVQSNESEWQWSLVQIYHGFGITIASLISRLNNLESNTDSALVYTLTNILLNPETPALTVQQGNSVLDTLEKYAPNRVAEIVLRSCCLKDYKKDKALAILKKELSKYGLPRPVDVLALAVIILDRGSPEQVSTVLGLLRPHHLLEILQQYSWLLIHETVPVVEDDCGSATPSGSLSSLGLSTPNSSFPNTPRSVEPVNSVTLTPLALVLLDHKWDIFCDLFLSVIGLGNEPDSSITYNNINITLDTFCQALMEVRPIVTCGPECNINSLRLRDFLETYFNEYANSIAENEKEDGRYEHSISVLISLYLASLLGAFTAKTKEEIIREEQRQCLHAVYASRSSFLNILPPFDYDPRTSYKTEQSCSTPEDKRNNVDLIILQSLLSSNLPSESDRQNVVRFAKSNPNLKGSDGILAAALTGQSQMMLVMEKYPHALYRYTKVGKLCA